MIITRARAAARRMHDRVFNKIHGACLIYNACWEDPRLDRELLGLGPGQSLVMLTSAGCNALDYLLDDPAEIHCVDLNPRQNALLELKLAMFSRVGPEELFAMFGEGRCAHAREIYARARPALPQYARDYWDRHVKVFEPSRLGRSFYYRGASGNVAWAVRNLARVSGVGRRSVDRLLEAEDLAAQREAYARIDRRFWNPLIRAMVRNPLTMAMLGVPRSQIQLIREQYPGGLSAYIREKMRHVFTELPMRDNYFWRVYLTGRYTRECCPNYLKPENFPIIRSRVDRVRVHSCSLAEFLRRHPRSFDAFVLLDHQDWLAAHRPDELEEEWRLILDRSRVGTTILMRSAALEADFIPESARARLRFLDQAARRHPQDRVGTYGCFLAARVR